jgi:4-hydroxy-4-methyl-2-oxoglutarate aldolase
LPRPSRSGGTGADHDRIGGGAAGLGDDDGLVVATEEEVLAVLDAAEAIQRREEALRAAIGAGSSLFDSTNYDEHVAAVRAGRDSRLTFL